MIPVADMHCDLLCYLEGNSKRTVFDPEVRCSIPQLKAGGVKLQIMAIFTETGSGSLEKGMRQFELFKSLSKSDHGSIDFRLAIENASSLCAEEEPLNIALQRIDQIQKITPITYISLTWNTENRFGGGAHTKIGLKSDGMSFLDFLSDKHIALDLSHASDQLALDSLIYIDKKKLNISVLASHSNFRTITNVPRNLPDELVKEIFQRKGLIGLNFVRDFVGADHIKNFARQLDYGLKLGGASHICLGADFYFGGDVSPAYRKHPDQMFFPEFSSSATYGDLFNLWRRELGTPEPLLHAIAHDNLMRWLNRVKYKTLD